jgi:hypothetical protein
MRWEEEIWEDCHGISWAPTTRFERCPLRLRSLYRCGKVGQELDEELRYHIDQQIEENIVSYEA